jgi:nucleotide-binding universal stress UspA family protein
MRFKTILVHVDLRRDAPARIQTAAGLARAYGATLLGAAMTGMPRAMFPPAEDAAPPVDRARQALSRFEAIAAEAGVAWETRLVHDQVDDGLARMARFADLVVTSQDDPDEPMSGGPVGVPEYVVMNSSRPVLVAPRTLPPPAAGHTVLLAWDGSREAAFAMHAAMPLLCRAAAVTVVTLTGPGLAAPNAGGDKDELLGYLKRNDVYAAWMTREATAAPGRDLLAVAAAQGCNLLVMGCYGHGKWREFCLGGPSRTVLAEAAIPLLLAH